MLKKYLDLDEASVAGVAGITKVGQSLVTFAYDKLCCKKKAIKTPEGASVDSLEIAAQEELSKRSPNLSIVLDENTASLGEQSPTTDNVEPVTTPRNSGYQLRVRNATKSYTP